MLITKHGAEWLPVLTPFWLNLITITVVLCKSGLEENEVVQRQATQLLKQKKNQLSKFYKWIPIVSFAIHSNHNNIINRQEGTKCLLTQDFVGGVIARVAAQTYSCMCVKDR